MRWFILGPWCTAFLKLWPAQEIMNPKNLYREAWCKHMRDQWCRATDDVASEKQHTFCWTALELGQDLTAIIQWYREIHGIHGIHSCKAWHGYEGDDKKLSKTLGGLWVLDLWSCLLSRIVIATSHREFEVNLVIDMNWNLRIWEIVKLSKVLWCHMMSPLYKNFFHVDDFF